MKQIIKWALKHPWILLGLAVMGFSGYQVGFEYLARAHFDEHCEKDAGEFIYRTVENVEGVYQMRLRDPRDYIGNLRAYAYGQEELLEDPFGHTDREAQQPETLFVSPPIGNYKYLETTKAPNIHDARYAKTRLAQDITDNGVKYWIYRSAGHIDERDIRSKYSVVNQSSLKSQYGFTWREIRDEKDKQYGIWGGELIVKDLKTDETLAVRRGYFFLRDGKYATICPLDKTHEITYLFISKVLKPINQK